MTDFLGLLRTDAAWEVGEATGWEATLLEGDVGLGLFIVGVEFSEGVAFKK